MSKVKRTLSAVLLILSITACKGQDSSQELFDDYLEEFENQSLPYAAYTFEDKKATFIIDGNFTVFIPSSLRENVKSTFRGVCLLPVRDNFKAVLIMEKFIDGYGDTVTKIHAITYKHDGTLIDDKELAGFLVDSWQAFSNILEGYIIDKSFYQYLYPEIEDKDMKGNHALLEVKTRYRIDQVGKIIEEKVTTVEGYFQSKNGNYKLVKKFN